MTNFKLDPDKKSEWLRKLRSGNYKQGEENLRNFDNTYCCLGVYTEVLHDNPWVEDPDGDAYQYIVNKCSKYLSESEIPGYIQDKLVSFNDDEKCSFIEIADWIEQNL